jgi:hypothetical protein
MLKSMQQFTSPTTNYQTSDWHFFWLWTVHLASVYIHSASCIGFKIVVSTISLTFSIRIGPLKCTFLDLICRKPSRKKKNLLQFFTCWNLRVLPLLYQIFYTLKILLPLFWFYMTQFYLTIMGELWDSHFCDTDIGIDFYFLIMYNLLLKISFNVSVHMSLLNLTITDLQYV